MSIVYIFPLILMTLNVAAAAVYAMHGDLRMMLYWFSAATLTFCVTFRW